MVGLDEARIRRLPRHHEHGQALVHRPADEALLRVQVEDVEAVDPGREDHDRGRQHLLGGRGILEQLVEWGLVNDLAGRHRDVAPHLERVRIGVGELPALEVRHQVVEPLEQVLPLGLEGLLEDQRVGQREVGRAERVGERAGREAELLSCFGSSPDSWSTPFSMCSLTSK
jgi:hypothetical protein